MYSRLSIYRTITPYLIHTKMKWKCHFHNILIIVCTRSCHVDNFRFSQWRKFRWNDTFCVAVQHCTSKDRTFLTHKRRPISTLTGELKDVSYRHSMDDNREILRIFCTDFSHELSRFLKRTSRSIFSNITVAATPWRPLTRGQKGQSNHIVRMAGIGYSRTYSYDTFCFARY